MDPYREGIHIGRARLFLNSGDFASAISALRPPVYPVTPASLEATRAQMLWDVGQQDEAYELICRAAKENPAHLGIWNRLEQWAMIRGDRPQAIAAVEHQMQAQPHNPDMLDAAGNTLAALDDKPKAIEAFRRAIEIAPGFAGSRSSLFDLLIEQDQWEEAATIMRDLPRGDQHSTVIARRMQIAVHEGNQEQAEQDFEAIMSSDPWSSWAVDQAIEMMIQAGMRTKVVERVEQALADKDSNREFGRTWTTLRLSKPVLPATERYQQIADRIQQLVAGQHPDAGHSAMSALMPELTREGMASKLKRFVNKNEHWIRNDTHCWTMVAFAYADCPTAVSKSQIRRWIAGWPERSDFKPWMLTNVHELCRVVGDQQGGRQAVQMALAMPPDHMQSQLRLWAAHDALVEGDQQLALKHFMGASRLEQLEGLERVLHRWVESVINAHQSADKRATFKQIRKQLAEVGTTPAFFASQPAYRLPYQRTLRMIAEAIGTPQAKIWAFTKIFRVKLTRIGLT
jgi:tetratricopeptide (TPR) repeat protein